MPRPLRALLVEDSEDDAELLVRALRRGDYEVEYRRVDSEETLLKGLAAGGWDIVISDYSMPGFSGMAALTIVRERGFDMPFVFVSGTMGEDIAVEAMKTGAQDYIVKGNLSRLLPAIERELRESGIRREHKLVEMRMRQLEKFEVIGRLAGGIAHDFNNVLGAIMGWAELGRGEVAAGTRAEFFFQNILQQSERAAGLTRQLLAYARRQVLEPRNINMNQMIGEATALLQKVIGDHIEIRMVLAPDLQLTRADPAQMEQVLMNLCINARDAMPKGGQLLIETNNAELDEQHCRRRVYARPGQYVRLSITDNGTGIDPETLERIFEPFFTTKDVGKGTGLGLATALGVVNQHGGSIDVYSELGRGTTFHVYLPVSRVASEPVEQAEEGSAGGGTETILLADDHEGVRDMTVQVLESLGYKVVLANDGETAVKQFTAHRNEISLLLLDVVMPRLQGPDAYAKICEVKPDVPVIFTSGYSEEAASLSPLVARGALILQKPYGRKELARRVRELLNRRVAR
jgi:two-component system cell cycle sensor histidine kinase/response regulator CckA